MLGSCNASENVMGTAHTNPLLDSGMYQVAFAWGKVTELTTNVIAKSMYAQCNANGNEYLLLDVLVDYHRDNKAISLVEQQTSIQGRLLTQKITAGWQIFCQWKDGSTSCKKNVQVTGILSSANS